MEYKYINRDTGITDQGVRTMHIFPAIDLLDGQCVRLRQGDFNDVTVYDSNPVSVALRFQEAGASRIHIVDLDAARGRSFVNRKKIRKIRKATRCELELGGGVRSEDDIEELIDLGIDYMVLGTVFVLKPDMVAGWLGHYGDIFIAGIDARDGSVRIEGWEREVRISDTELAVKAQELGFSSLIYTNISSDGMMEGPDLDRTNTIADVSGLRVVHSGGIGSMKDLDELSAKKAKGVIGCIAGRALYENKIDLAEAVRKYAGA
jgi:phosphoribosylformimino-5-aminoimidazole carboxamide ribotide isomerase